MRKRNFARTPGRSKDVSLDARAPSEKLVIQLLMAWRRGGLPPARDTVRLGPHVLGQGALLRRFCDARFVGVVRPAQILDHGRVRARAYTTAPRLGVRTWGLCQCSCRLNLSGTPISALRSGLLDRGSHRNPCKMQHSGETVAFSPISAPLPEGKPASGFQKNPAGGFVESQPVANKPSLTSSRELLAPFLPPHTALETCNPTVRARGRASRIRGMQAGKTVEATLPANLNFLAELERNGTRSASKPAWIEGTNGGRHLSQR
jgi:hypothetical protein